MRLFSLAFISLFFAASIAMAAVPPPMTAESALQPTSMPVSQPAPVPVVVPTSNPDEVPPFGAELFQGNFAKSVFDELDPNYLIMAGDRVVVRIWGARTLDGVFEVDAKGYLFLPEIGPVKVGGLKQSQLTDAVSKKIGQIYFRNVEVYVDLISAQPVAVYVTGFVRKPGRYAGGPTESILYYLDMAGGIDAERGSYRDIRIQRDDKLLASVDLYPFILNGSLPRPRLQEGDVIIVGERGSGIIAQGQVRHQARFEFPVNAMSRGYELAKFAIPLNTVSHTSIIGTRSGAPFNTYLSLTEFSSAYLQDGDTVEFHADTPRDTIMVSVSGAIVGASRYPVKKDTRLKSLLPHIAVEPELANLQGIHIKRRSVAQRQKKSLDEALSRLEYTALTATSKSVDEANIRVREAELISQFVEKAKVIQPDGTMVIGRDGQVNDLYLEDGDVIVVPFKSDMVSISGEVLMPQTIIYKPELDVDDYIASTGGFSDRADKGNVLLIKPNGEVLEASDTRIAAGDQIMVLPRFETKNLQLFKDISQILYQLAIAARAVAGW
jgi:protein involved in polysaccharide export with SLBB domain